MIGKTAVVEVQIEGVFGNPDIPGDCGVPGFIKADQRGAAQLVEKKRGGENKHRNPEESHMSEYSS